MRQCVKVVSALLWCAGIESIEVNSEDAWVAIPRLEVYVRGESDSGR